MELKSLMDKSSREIRCPECGSWQSIQKKGFRKTRRENLQKYYCKDCGRYFVMKKMLHKTYPTNVILTSISFYNKGMTLSEASKKVNRKYGIKTSPRLISYWMNEFSDICTFRRIRGKFPTKRGFAFPNPVFEKMIEHKQPYFFKYHKLKIDLFLRDYFSGLKDYLLNLVDSCPHEMFLRDNLRSSQLKIDYGTKKKIKIEKKDNYACKLAGLALKMARTNKQRHAIIQDFMLANDTATIAVEVPIWLTAEEVRKINSEFSVFPDIQFCGSNSEKDDLANENDITGHIDIVQTRFGLIYILDYKPEAERVDAVSQLFTYALALSVRTEIWLRNFKCAWFDEKGYYEFNPNDIILSHISKKFSGGKIPEQYLKKYVLNERAKHYFTSLRFHEKYVEDKTNKSGKADEADKTDENAGGNIDETAGGNIDEKVMNFSKDFRDGDSGEVMNFSRDEKDGFFRRKFDRKVGKNMENLGKIKKNDEENKRK